MFTIEAISGPIAKGHSNTLKASQLDTPLGPMIAIADEAFLYLLEFMDRKALEPEIERLRKNTKSAITPGKTKIISLIESEINQYFNGTLQTFKTPIFIQGSPFQKTVWDALKKIPYGETRSYLELAKAIKKPTACRAVAKANSTNQFAIIIPCHRVINSDGTLGGYAGGIEKKQWLLNHEKK